MLGAKVFFAVVFSSMLGRANAFDLNVDEYASNQFGNILSNLHLSLKTDWRVGAWTPRATR